MISGITVNQGRNGQMIVHVHRIPFSLIIITISFWGKTLNGTT